MLADRPSHLRPLGALNPSCRTLLWNSFLTEFYRFLGTHLHAWSVDAERPHQTSENALTEQLCSYLNSASNRARGWDVLQFKVEAIDEHNAGRKIDLVASPCGHKILVRGRSYTHYQNIIPIECKRLPTPKDSGRDEREYVIDGHSTLGGIQRFKLGLHGKAHKHGAMIAYVQAKTCSDWFSCINGWIYDLVAKGHSGWSATDALKKVNGLKQVGMTVYGSTHQRADSVAPIRLRHFWVEMPAGGVPRKRQRS